MTGTFWITEEAHALLYGPGRNVNFVQVPMILSIDGTDVYDFDIDEGVISAVLTIDAFDKMEFKTVELLPPSFSPDNVTIDDYRPLEFPAPFL